MKTLAVRSGVSLARSIKQLLASLAVALVTCVARGQALDATVLQEIGAMQQEKALRSPVERKLDSQFVYALRESRNQVIANGVPLLRSDVKREADGRILVDIDAVVTPQLLKQIEAAGGTVINQFPNFNAIRALLPLAGVENIAGQAGVKFVRSAVGAFTNTGSVNSQGDATHKASTARSSFGVNGSSVKIGVLSDSVDFLASSQANGNLPTVTVLPGQSGVPGTGEGTAMLEIIADLAPGAQLYFASAFNGVASFAQNILDLRAQGCDIIVDDVGYFNESPFQDGPIAQAVNTVTAAGALYFSSAANSGNLNDSTSGTWEGDFLDGGPAPSSPPLNSKGGRIHNFGGATFNTVASGGSSRRVDLFWADPLGGSANDYDVYVLNSTGTSVLRASNNIQSGTTDPYENIGTLNIGERIVIVKASGADRFLHLETGRARLTISTSGSTHGHSAAVNAFSVAAVNAATSFPNPFTGGVANPIETFSSDGLRRVFYQANGTPITPGNFTSTGGAVRQKPDIAAADGVSTSVPGFGSFFGTSAAAPHAAAIAGLLLSYNPALTTAQVRSLLTSTALDIEAVGVDRDSGAGIVMALPALQAAPLPQPMLEFSASAVSAGNGNGTVDFNECNQLSVTLFNSTSPSGGAATGVSATISSTTPGVSIAQAVSAYPNVPAGGTAANSVPFQISTTPGFACGTIIDLTLQVTTANAGNFTIPFQLSTGHPGASLPFASTDVPKPIVDLSTANSTVSVSGLTAPIGKVTVSLFLTHTFDGDLTLSLIGPDNTTVVLAGGIGGPGDNYGSSCGARTVFDDSSVTPIGAGTAPFVGTFAPQQALALFSGKSGSAANGIWTLRVFDGATADTGTLQCWSLNVAPLTCTDGGGQCGGQTTRTLTVNSSPNSGVSINVNPNDNNGQGNGTTSFTRTYNNNAVVNLVAPATAGGNNFQKWQRDGVDWSTVPATSVTMDLNHTMTAIYVAPPRTLTVASSNPNSGVAVTVSPNDNNGQGNGNTQFTRTYNNNTVVNLTAPATAGGNNFQKWQRDGVDWAFTAATSVTMDLNHTMTAIYVTPTRTLTVNSVNPNSGVNVNVNPNDNNGQGNGTTQFTRTYNNNTIVNLTAPATAGGNNFQKWQRDGVDWAFTVATSVTMDLNHILTAVYTSPSNTGPVGRWRFEEGTGFTANDSSGNGNTGTLINGPAWTAGKFGGGLQLDGADDYVDVGNAAILNPTTALTLVAWVKPNSTTTTGGLIIKDNGTTHQYALWLQLGGKVRLTIGSSVLTGTTTVTTGAWHLLAGTYDGSQLKIYLDGALEGTLAASGLMSNSGVNVRLGGRQLANPLTLNGTLDDARIYDRALSQSEIQALLLNVPPSVSLTSPANGATFTAGANITLNATATDSDGAISKVDFFANSILIGTTTVGSGNVFSLPWNNVAAGNYALTARATDDSGANTTSTPAVNITVTAAGDPTLVGYWKLDDGSGFTAADASGNGNTGALINGPVWSAGAASGALSFDGVNDYVDLGNGASLNPTTAITLVAWVKANSTTTTGGLIVKDSGTSHQYALLLQLGGKVRLTLGVATLTGTTVVTTGVWHQLAATYDGATMKIYLDGALEGTLAASGVMSNIGVNARLGGRQFTTPLTLNGALDAARIYNRALTQSEIQALSP